jgi:hypothetical protein
MKLFIPALKTVQAHTPEPEPEQPGTLPANLVGTWYSGNAPLIDFYDPTTGSWRDVSGLGQSYTFAADGSYTYAGFLRIQNGLCRTEVSTYRSGSAAVEDAALVVTAKIAKTRTVVVCGSTTDTTTEGPFTPVTLGWQVKDDELGRPKLVVQEGSQTSEYYKHGMVEALVGGWSLNGVASAGFYDAATGKWATPAQDGAWFRFTADGRYSFGEYLHGVDDQGCATTTWVYQEGTLTVSGGRLSYQAADGRGRIENACAPGQVTDTPYVDPKLYEFTWELHDLTTAPKLAVSPMGEFRYIVFDRE